MSNAITQRLASPFSVWKTWCRQEILLLIREPVAIFFSLAFPLIIYGFMGIPYGDHVIDEANNIRFIDIMFPSLVGTVAANLLIMGMPIYMAELRAKGVTKRYRALPMNGLTYAFAVLSAMVTLIVAGAFIVVAVVSVKHGVRAEALLPAFTSLNIGFVTLLCGLGEFLGSLPFSGRTVQALSAAMFFLMFFGSGAASPIENLPQWLQRILEYNPLKIWFDAMVATYTSQPISTNLWLRLAGSLVICLALGALGAKLWNREE